MKSKFNHLWLACLPLLPCFAGAQNKESESSVYPSPLTEEGQKAMPRDGVKIFGLLLGRDSFDDVASLVKLQPNSLCSSGSRNENCKATLEVQDLGWVNDNNGRSIAISRHGDIKPSDLGINFAKFMIDGEYITGTFFQTKLVGIAVNGKYSDELNAPFDSKALITSFDKKYRKSKSSKSQNSEHGVTHKYTYYSWQEATGAFEVNLEKREKLILNKIACLKYAEAFVSTSYYGIMRGDCDESFDMYKLSYRSSELYSQAFQRARQFDDNIKSAKSKSAGEKINKY